MDAWDLNSLINQLLDKISKEKKPIFLLEDFSINSLNYNEHYSTNEFVDSSLKFYHSIYFAEYQEILLQPFLISIPIFVWP